MTESDLVATIVLASSWRVLSRRNPSVNFTVENKLGWHMPVVAREEPDICCRSRWLRREPECYGGLEWSKAPLYPRGLRSWCCSLETLAIGMSDLTDDYLIYIDFFWDPRALAHWCYFWNAKNWQILVRFFSAGKVDLVWQGPGVAGTVRLWQMHYGHWRHLQYGFCWSLRTFKIILCVRLNILIIIIIIDDHLYNISN